MHFLLIGATGQTGRLVLSSSLSEGHTTTALVRNISSFRNPDPSLVTLSQGTPFSLTDVISAFDASPRPIDAVIVTLNVAKSSSKPWAKRTSPPNLMEQTTRNALSVMKQRNVRRLVVLQAWGVGDSYAAAPWLIRQLVDHTVLAEHFKDHEAALDLVRHKQGQEQREGGNGDGVEWIFPRPVRMIDGDDMAIKEHGDVGEGLGSFVSVTRASVAAYLVEAAAAASGSPGMLAGRTPVISN